MTSESGEPDEETWIPEQRAEISRYLKLQKVDHGGIAEQPDWHVCPYVSIWRIGSLRAPGTTGWWAIAGDLPTDYLSSISVRDARQAMQAFADRWFELVPFVRSGEPHETIRMGGPGPNPELAGMLDTRAQILLGWARDDELWVADAQSDASA